MSLHTSRGTQTDHMRVFKALRRSIKGEKDGKPHVSIAPKSALAIVPPKKVRHHLAIRHCIPISQNNPLGPLVACFSTSPARWARWARWALTMGRQRGAWTRSAAESMPAPEEPRSGLPLSAVTHAQMLQLWIPAGTDTIDNCR